MPSECAGNPYFTLRTFRARRTGLRTCLLRSEVADNWQLELLIAVSLDHADNYRNHNAQPNYHHQWTHNEKTKSMGDKAQDRRQNKSANPEGEHSDAQKYRLKGMEANETIILVRFNHQKNQAGNPTDEIAETCSHIVGHPRARCTRR